MGFAAENLTSDFHATLGALQGSDTLPILLPNEEWDVSEGETRLTRRWVVAMSRVRSGSGVPNYSSVFPDPGAELPDYQWMTVERYRVRQKSKNGKLGVVEQTAIKTRGKPAPDPLDPDALPEQDPDAGGFTIDPDQLPDDELIFEGSTQQVDIRRHHLFRTDNAAWGNNSMLDFWDAERGGFNFAGVDMADANNATARDELDGLTHFLVAGLTVRHRTYSLTEPTEASFYNTLGTFSIPPGITFTGAAEHWMVIGGTREQAPGSGIWAREFVYLYSEKEWPPWLEAGGTH